MPNPEFTPSSNVHSDYNDMLINVRILDVLIDNDFEYALEFWSGVETEFKAKGYTRPVIANMLAWALEDIKPDEAIESGGIK